MTQGVTGIAYPRAALIGNPSDGFGGMTIAFVFSDFNAQVTLKEHKRIEVLPGLVDHLNWDNLEDFQKSVSSMGYYGGLRLLKATLLVFIQHCNFNKIPLHKKGFQLSYTTNIPVLLGLSGSSAIISACLRALGIWYSVKMEPWLLANLAWQVETEELGIPAGLQDRVAQAYNFPVFMDFDKSHFNTNPHGKYEKLKRPIKNVYIAYSDTLAEGSDVTHSNLRERFEAGDSQLLEAVETWKSLTLEFKGALEKNDFEKMNECINANFDLRNEICELDASQVSLVRLARKSGASAKFCGSGGAIIGLYKDSKMLSKLKKDLNSKGVNILLPEIVYSP
ncbi:MAG: glucuronokinase [Bacteroidia bacterium]|jgi:glucuronokinase